MNNEKEETNTGKPQQPPKIDLSKKTYAGAGVCLASANETNQRIKDEIISKGGNAEGLFAGGVSIKELKYKSHAKIGIACSSLIDNEDSEQAGRDTVKSALEKILVTSTPLAMLDYYASPEMGDDLIEFVRGVVSEGKGEKTGMSINRRDPIDTIGGESAQMPGTYQKGKRDAYVHVLYHGNQGETVDLTDKIKDKENPVLVATADGTGTKQKIIKNTRDIINHGSNDLGAAGVEAIGFALYVAGNVDTKELFAIVEDAKEACAERGITYLGAHVAHKTDAYIKGEVDIAGTVIGVADKKDIIKGGEAVKLGDIIIGFATDCLMTNGYSLARDCIKDTKGEWDEEGLVGLEGTTKRKELSKPHVPYKDILFGNENAEGILSKYKGHVKAIAHITGGGQAGNINRMIPDGLCAVVKKEVLPLPPIVKHFQAYNVNMDEMYASFNMGIGFTVTVSPEVAEEVINYVNENFKDAIKDVERTAAAIGKIGIPTQKFRYAN